MIREISILKQEKEGVSEFAPKSLIGLTAEKLGSKICIKIKQEKFL